MDKNTIHIEGFTGNELIVREGSAPKVVEPVGILVDGNIDTPLNWLKLKIKKIVEINAHIQVDRSAGKITLLIEENLPIGNKIKGMLTLDPEFTKWGINTGGEITPYDLAEFIKMNRSAFKDKTDGMKLVKDLRSFKVKVDKELEAIKNDRANYSLKKSQIVDTNVPAGFTIEVPIIKGQPKESILVEININAESLDCSLISPAVNDYIHDFKDKIINEQIEAITMVAPNIAILEV
jgi:hypothetical protein